MCYLISDNNFFLGKDFKGRPTASTEKDRAYTFKEYVSANNFLKCIPLSLKSYNWKIYNSDETSADFTTPEVKVFGNPTKTTILENEDFDLLEFFTEVIQVMSNLDRFIANMTSNEEITNMKILDVRHYIRDNNHRLSAIQMQRLGYYLQDLEKERYSYKSRRLIASMVANNIDSLKDKNTIDKMNDVVTSRYNPKILDDKDIEYIINKKKSDEFIA